MGLFTADFARQRGASVLVVNQWRIGDSTSRLPSLADARVVEVEGADQCSYHLVGDDNFILGEIPGLPGAAVGTGWRGTGYKFFALDRPDLDRSGLREQDA